MKQDKREALVFMPFEFSSLPELESWVAKDTSLEIKTGFGPKVRRFEDIKQQIIPTLIGNSNSYSMMVTIRTSYHRLINIGYVRLTQKSKNARKVCYIECLYLSKAFREKDYEYRTLKKSVEFALNDLQCTSCFIWINKSNYIFLSIARTLSFQLVKTDSDTSKSNVRYCYAITLPNNYKAMAQGYAIPKKTVKDMCIPNYLFFKKNVVKMNSEQRVDKGTFKRKEGVFYSPILRSEAIRLLEDNKYTKLPTINSASVRNLRGCSEATKNTYNTGSEIVERFKYNKMKMSENKDTETSSTIKTITKYQKLPIEERRIYA